jgi:hypothetical protein
MLSKPFEILDYVYTVKLGKRILKKINQELKANNLQVEIAEAAIVDAIIIESQAHPEHV